MAEFMRVRINHLVNSLTRQALFETVPGYVSKEVDFGLLETQVRSQYGLNQLHRFDLGENAFGCSPSVHDFILGLSDRDLSQYLSSYPETAATLKYRISELAAMLRSGEIDVANCSIFEGLQQPGLALVRNISISADGAVKSVRL